MFDLGQVTIGLDLDRSYLDQSLRQVEKDLKRYSNKRFKIKVEVDDTRLYELNAHFDIKKKHHAQLQQYFDRNPLTPRVNSSELDRLKSITGTGQSNVTVNMKTVTKIEARSATEAIRPVTELLKEIRRNTRPRGIVSTALGGLIKLSLGNATKGVFQGLGEQFAATVSSEFRKNEGGQKAVATTRNIARRTGEIGASSAAQYSEMLFGGSRRRGNAVKTM